MTNLPSMEKMTMKNNRSTRMSITGGIDFRISLKTLEYHNGMAIGNLQDLINSFTSRGTVSPYKIITF